jgi:hypothetical protein
MSKCRFHIPIARVHRVVIGYRKWKLRGCSVVQWRNIDIRFHENLSIASKIERGIHV